MGQVIAFARCEIEICSDGVPTEAMVSAAWSVIEEFADRLNDQLLVEGASFRRVKVRPVPSPELLEAIKRPGAVRLEVEYEPVEAGGESS